MNSEFTEVCECESDCHGVNCHGPECPCEECQYESETYSDSEFDYYDRDDNLEECELDEILNLFKYADISLDQYNFLMQNFVFENTPSDFIPKRSTYETVYNKKQLHDIVFRNYKTIDEFKNLIVNEGGENIWQILIKSIADKYNLNRNFRSHICKKFLGEHYNGPLYENEN